MFPLSAKKSVPKGQRHRFSGAMSRELLWPLRRLFGLAGKDSPAIEGLRPRQPLGLAYRLPNYNQDVLLIRYRGATAVLGTRAALTVEEVNASELRRGRHCAGCSRPDGAGRWGDPGRMCQGRPVGNIRRINPRAVRTGRLARRAGWHTGAGRPDHHPRNAAVMLRMTVRVCGKMGTGTGRSSISFGSCPGRPEPVPIFHKLISCLPTGL